MEDDESVAQAREEAKRMCQYCAAGERVITTIDGHWYHPRAVGRDPYGKLILCGACRLWKYIDEAVLACASM